MQKNQALITVTPFDSLAEEIVFQILDLLEPDPQDKKSFSVVCKSCHSIEARHRKTLKPLQADFIPGAVQRYTRVRRVDFTNCPRIDDKILTTVANAYSETLRSVDLSKSRFFTQVGLLSLVAKCAGLVELDLSNATELKDTWAAAIAEAKNLEKLDEVTDLGVGLIANKCRELCSLDLSYLPITDECLSPILQLQNLKELALVGCHGIDDESLAKLKQGCKSLEVLDISNCDNITDNGLGSLTNGSRSLRQLNLAYCFSVTFDLEKCFYKLSALQSIKLDGCRVSCAALKAIADCCESLKELSLCKCNGVTDEGLSYIARKHRQLRKLDMTCCPEITDAAIASITASCNYITSFRMEACVMVQNEGFVLIGQHCPSLEDIDITENVIDDEGLEAISRCSKLLNLKMGLSMYGTDHGLSHVGRRCQNLIELDLYRCMWITDVGIGAIANAKCLQLKALEIRGCPSVSSVGLSAIAMGCKHLTILDIKKCDINDAGLIHLAHYSQYLKQINISYCPVTDDGLLALASISCLRNLTILHVIRLTPDGLIAALLACQGLMKLKLHTHYKSLIPEAILGAIEARGCAIHWRNKPYWVNTIPFHL
ncbi:UNVERIFIED_CONTAM: F-box/LRR-repeat protein 3 [Sesamum calycinum]|uniref:F-box/LRR-repeat protein 3 n=1 Tax=Sesamum calycinum TaxID=2727403 RepID=A0AAW2SAC2_9LAMI